jgi:hypothetical protein
VGSGLVSMPPMGSDRREQISEGSGGPNDRSRYTVPEAARVLGISPEAVRNRLSRGTLDSVKVEGTVYVLLDRDRTRYTADTPTDIPGESSALTSQMQGEIDYLRGQLEEEREARRRADTLLAQLMQRIPELEPPAQTPPDERDARETDEDEPGGGPPRPGAPGPHSGATGAQRRPWWRRMFGR